MCFLALWVDNGMLVPPTVLPKVAPVIIEFNLSVLVLLWYALYKYRIESGLVMRPKYT